MRVAAAGNTVVPALLALEKLGFTISMTPSGTPVECVARRGEDEYLADDPVAVLGLVKLAEMTGSGWQATDREIDATVRKYGLG